MRWKSFLQALFLVVLVVYGSNAVAEIKIFQCRFPASDFKFFITIYDDGSPARVGVEQGIGNFAKAYFDSVTESWVIVEYIARGKIPSTLTTITAEGDAYHSRHILIGNGIVLASQMVGNCTVRSIR